MAEIEEQAKPHVAMLPSVGMGHFIPFAALAVRLARDFGCRVTFMAFHSVLHSPPARPHAAALADCEVQVITLPDPRQDDDTVLLEHRIVSMIVNSTERVLDIVRGCGATALIVDLFCAPLFDAGLPVPCYAFYTSSASLLSLTLHAPDLDYANENGNSASLREADAVVELPGYPPLHWKHLPSVFWDAEGFRSFQQHSSMMNSARGFLINTFDDLEGAGLKGIQTKPANVWAVGPLLASMDGYDEEDCIKWMDAQPAGSVVVISLGSSGALDTEQTAELALGLEATGLRFVWVVRDKRAANYVAVTAAETRLEEVLPEGFMDRTRDRGLLLPSWAPQAALLRHAATGGFVTHCGWNSVLESLACGVPMLTWPITSDQPMSAVLLVREFGAALEVRTETEETGGVVRRGQVQSGLCELMQGEHGKHVRRRAHDLRDAAHRALAVGGSSYAATARALAEMSVSSPVSSGTATKWPAFPI